MTTNVEVVTGTNSKLPVFSGKHGNNRTIWEIKFPAYLMKKGLGVCLDPKFEDRLPTKENGPFNLAVEVEKNFKGAVNLNKKTMGQFIQEFSTMNLLSKANMQKKADKSSQGKSMETMARIADGVQTL